MSQCNTNTSHVKVKAMLANQGMQQVVVKRNFRMNKGSDLETARQLISVHITSRFG